MLPVMADAPDKKKRKLVTFPGLGHLLFWEDPDGFAAAVASFLLGPRPGS